MNLKKLTAKEEEIMRLYWEKGPMFVRELLNYYPEPRPHFNTVSTMVRSLEAKGYLAHHSFGNSYQYYPIVSEEDYGRNTIKGAVSRYFENSYLTAVSALVEEEKISLDDLKELIARIENQQ